MVCASTSRSCSMRGVVEREHVLDQELPGPPLLSGDDLVLVVARRGSSACR